MPDAPASFARAAPGVRAAMALQEGEFLHTYTGTLESGSGTVRLLVLAPEVSDTAVASAFRRVAADWEAIGSQKGTVTVHGRGETPRPWLAVEAVDGRRLSDRDTPIPVSDVRSLVGTVAEILRKAGRAGVHHGSLDPDTVWLTGSGVRVDGWGLERACRAAAGGEPVGPYTAPELATGDATPGDRTDVYGLGAVTYYTLTGQSPKEPDAGSRRGVDSESRPRASTLNPDVPGEFDEVLDTALSRDPQERYATPYEFKLATLFDSHGQASPAGSEGEGDGSGEARSEERGRPTGAGNEERAVADEAEGGPEDTDMGAIGGYPVTRRAALGVVGLGVVGAAGWAATERLGGSDPPDAVPMFQYDAGNTGYAPDVRGPRTDAEVVWTAESPPQVLQPIVAGGTIYLGGVDRVLAIDVADGSERWSVSDPDRATVDPEGFWSLPAVAEGQAHFVRTRRSNEGEVEATVHAFDADDGTALWQSESVTGNAPQPLIPTVTGDTVFFSAPNGIYGVDIADGTTRVQLDDWPDPGLFQAFDDERLYFTSRDGLYALDRDGWTEQWSLEDSFGWGLTAVDDSVYVPSSTEEGPAVRAVSASNGETRWTVPLEDRTLGPIAVADGTLFAGTREGVLHAINTATGGTAWTKQLGQGTGPPAIVTGDTVYAGTLEEELFALNAADGSERWTTEVPDVSGLPAVVDGMLFVSGSEQLFAVSEP